MRFKIIIFCISLVATLFILEGFLRMNLLHISYTNVSDWWNLEWLRNAKSYISQNTAYVIDKYHPVLGWSMKENVHITSSLGNVVSSGTHGFRGEKEYKIAKPIGSYRIVALGDSYTFGECVGDKETYASYIEQYSNFFEVINMGVHGYGTDQIMLKLQLEGVKYQPDIVLLGFINDDVNRISLTFRDYFKPKFVFDGKVLHLTNVPISPPDVYKAKPHTYLGLSLRAALTNMYQSIFYKKTSSENNALASAILDQLTKTTHTLGAQLYVVYLPSVSEVIANQINPHESYRSLCQNSSVICINPTETLHLYLKTVPNPTRLFQCHYSKEVHQIIASVIGDYLIDHHPFTGPSP